MASAEEIPPGGEGKIKVTYKTRNKAGEKTQTITVYSNDPEHKIIQLKVKIEIETLLAVQPQKVYFGSIKKDALPSTEKEAVLIGNDKDTARIKSLLTSSEYVKAELVSSGTGDKNNGQQIKVSIQPGMKTGKFKERVMIHTDHKEKKRLTIQVTGSISGNILIYPSNLSFGSFRKGGKYDRKITLMAAPNVSFKVLDVSSTTPDLIPRLITKTEGAHYQVVVTLAESFDGDILRGKIMITTDDAEQKNIQVPISGRAFKERKITQKSTSDKATE